MEKKRNLSVKQDDSRVVRVRVTPQWYGLVSSMARGHNANLSAFIRSCAESIAHISHKAPYVSLLTRHVLFITRDGDFYYRRIEHLKANQPVTAVHCGIQMRAARTHYFMRNTKNFDELREQWAFNQFSISEHEPLGINNEQDTAMSDDVGVTGKFAWFSNLNIPKGRAFWRESIVVIRDYVDWWDKSVIDGSDEQRKDFVDFPIDVPSNGPIKIFVVVDKELFRNTNDVEIEQTAIWRNREFVPLGGDMDVTDKPYVKSKADIDLSASKWGDAAIRQYVGDAETELRQFHERLHCIDHATKQSSNPVFGSLPNKFLFYYMNIAFPRLDVMPTIGWPRPIRPT